MTDIEIILIGFCGGLFGAVLYILSCYYGYYKAKKEREYHQ